MAVRTSVGRRVGAVVFILTAAGCSGAPAPAPVGTATVASARSGPQAESAVSGRFVVTAADRSIDQADVEATGLPSRAGELVELRNPASENTLFLTVEEGKAVVAAEGWTATRLHADRVWNPSHCANLPHVLLGASHIVMLRDEGGPAVFEVFDIASKRFATAPIAAAGATVFTLSLQAHGPWSFSVLLQHDGELRRRTIDVRDFRYVDDIIDTTELGPIEFARASGKGYVIDSSAHRNASLALDAGRLVPMARSAIAIVGPPGRLSVLDARETPLPAEVQSASVVGQTSARVYLAFSTATTTVADGVGAVDRSTGAFIPIAGPQPDHLLVLAVKAQDATG